MAGLARKVGGYKDGGNKAYISFFGSPSRPPNVILGLLGVKNQTARDRIMYQHHAGIRGAYKTLKGHLSQSVILRMIVEIPMIMNKNNGAFLIMRQYFGREI
jgi:hypothetical protein